MKDQAARNRSLLDGSNLGLQQTDTAATMTHAFGRKAKPDAALGIDVHRRVLLCVEWAGIELVTGA